MADLTPITIAQFWSRVEVDRDDKVCWPWRGSRHPSGYGSFAYAKGKHLAHRMAYHLAKGVDPGALKVCHTCDNPPCCNPAHLFLGTHADNMQDMIAKGRRTLSDQVGENNGAAKLTNADVEKIRAQIAERRTNVAIAREFGVTHHMVSKIRRGRAWRTPGQISDAGLSGQPAIPVDGLN